MLLSICKVIQKKEKNQIFIGSFLKILTTCIPQAVKIENNDNNYFLDNSYFCQLITITNY